MKELFQLPDGILFNTSPSMLIHVMPRTRSYPYSYPAEKVI